MFLPQNINAFYPAYYYGHFLFIDISIAKQNSFVFFINSNTLNFKNITNYSTTYLYRFNNF